MHSPSLLSLEVKATNWKVSVASLLTRVNMTRETILDKFIGCELMFMASKNTA